MCTSSHQGHFNDTKGERRDPTIWEVYNSITSKQRNTYLNVKEDNNSSIIEHFEKNSSVF